MDTKLIIKTIKDLRMVLVENSHYGNLYQAKKCFDYMRKNFELKQLPQGDRRKG